MDYMTSFFRDYVDGGISKILTYYDFYKDDGKILLTKADNYKSYKDFEEAYYAECGYTPLHHAVMCNNVTIVWKILLKGANVNYEDNLSNIPLYYSILINNEEIIKLLLDNGASVDSRCFIQNTQIYYRPLHIAVMHKRLETIKILLNYGANVNGTNENEETPLYIACKENFVEAIELLLDKNALVNIYTKKNTIPLCAAIQSGNNKIVKLLLENGASIQNESVDRLNICNSLHVAASRGYLEIFQELLNYDLDVNTKYHLRKNKKDPIFLHAIVEYRQTELVKLFLKYNADINLKDGFGRTALHIAAKIRSKIMMNLLLSHNPDFQGVD